MPLSKNTLNGVAFGAPVPGQSLTSPPKSAAWEHPPQFTQIEEVMNYMMDQLTEPQHLKQLLQMMRAGMPIEAITRTLIFTGFATGKWTPDLGLLMYKPLMLALISMAHRAGIKDTPVLMPEAVQNQKNKQLEDFITSEGFKNENKQAEVKEPVGEIPRMQGFMSRSVN